MERAEIPGCDECIKEIEDENPADFAEQMLNERCPGCPWDANINDPLLFKLIEYLNLLDAGCPIERHELSNDEWVLLGKLKAERHRIGIERLKAKRERSAEREIDSGEY